MRALRPLRLFLLLVPVFACEGSLLECKGHQNSADFRGTWLGNAVAITFFGPGDARQVPALWAPMNEEMVGTPGFERNLLFGAQHSNYPYVNFSIWRSRRHLDEAEATLERPSASSPDTTRGIYEVAAHRGDVREPGSCMAIIPFVPDPGRNPEDDFRSSAEWFAQHQGFAGALLLRQVSGSGAPFVVVARWQSTAAFSNALSNPDFPLQTSGSTGNLGTYIPLAPGETLQ